jgi:tetratricopeptide (TPR) repeat protein
VAKEPAPESFVEEDFELAAPEEAGPILTPAGASPSSRPTIELSGPLTEEDREFVDEHLAEGRVFRKYGLVDKAADQFDAVISRFPDNVDARMELRDIFKEKGQSDKAAEQLLATAEIHRLKGNEAAAVQAEAEAEALLPKAAPPPEPAPAAAPPAVAATAKAAPTAPVAMFEADDEPADEEIPLEVEESGLDGPSLDVADDDGGGLPQLDLTDAGGDELSGQFLDEESEAPELSGANETPAAVEAAPADDATSFGDDALSFDDEATLALEDPEPEPPPHPAPRASPPPRSARPAPKPEPRPAARVSPRPIAPPPPAPPLRRPTATAKAESALPADLQRVLAEAEEFISLGFVDDAKDALYEISLRYPDHPAVAAKRAELGIDEAPSPFVAPPAAESQREMFDESETATLDAAELVDEEPAADEISLGGELEDAFSDLDLAEAPPEPETMPEPEPEFAPAPDESDAGVMSEFAGGIDLGAELGDLFGAQSAVAEVEAPVGGTDFGDAGLADIFKEFKKGVDKQLGKEDYDTRYNLGIAYKEMGLIDEAIAEFQLAAKDEGRLLECSSMLGICFLEKGMPKLAVKWFEKGLSAPGRSEEEYQGLKYDLAMAHESSGELDQALSLFTDLYGQNANFRDVATKVRELGASSR